MKDEMFEELVASLREAGAIMRGEAQPSRVFHMDKAHVKKIRENLGLSQNQFASLLGISVGTLRNWEQGRRKPEGPARVLLHIVARYPYILLDLVEKSEDNSSVSYKTAGFTSKLRVSEDND